MSDSLVRMEYKLDLIIQALQDKGLMLAELPSLSGIAQDICPVCGSQISVVPDFLTETPQYKCGCSVPVPVVRGISTVMRGPDANRKLEAQVPRNEAPDGHRERGGDATPGSGD